MKKLCLFRHAKSTYASLGTEDLDRPLHEIGIFNASLMGDILLKNHHFEPDVIVSSHAKRTWETARLISNSINRSEDDVVINKNIYDAGVEDLLREIEALDENYDNVLLIGHNPGLTLLANFLTDQHINNLPTCGVVCIEFKDGSWSGVADAENEVLFIDEPKNHH